MPASPKEIEDLKTALKNATNIFRQAAEELQNEKMKPENSEGIDAAQRAFDAASEKLGEALEKDVMARNLGGKRRRRRGTTKRRSRRASRRSTIRRRSRRT